MRAPSAPSLTLLIASLSAFSALGSAQDTASVTPLVTTAAPEQITLEAAVRRALENNLALSLEEYNRLFSRENLEVARAGFDPTISATSRRTFNQAVNAASDLEGAAAPTNENFNNSISVNQRISTGATASVSTNLNRASSNSTRETFNPRFDSGLSVNVRQPLLSGGGVRVNRAALIRAGIAIERSDLTFRARAMDIVRDTELAFYDLAFAIQQLEVRRSALAAAEALLNENEARQRAGLLTDLDVMSARVNIASRQQALLTAQQAVRTANDNLLAILGRTDLEGMLEPVGIEFTSPEAVNLQDSFATALQNDPDILSAQLQQEQLELDYLVARNNRLPRLDLGGTVGISGREDTRAGSYDLLSEGDSYNWQVDLTFSVPWGLRAEKSRVRTAKLSVEQQELRLRQLEQDLLVRVRQAVRAVQTDIESISISALSTELSAREFQLERARFESGLSTSRLVVEAQQRQDEAKVSETQTRFRLKQDAARLYRIEGNTLERFGLEIAPVTTEEQE